MDRRALLKSLAAVGVMGVSGCSGQQDSTTPTSSSSSRPSDTRSPTDAPTPSPTAAQSGPAHFGDVRISGPDEVAIDESFSITVSAVNVGGSTGDFTTTVTTSGPDFRAESSLTISEVEPGERKQRTFEDFRRVVAGDVQVQIMDHGASHTVSVLPTTFEAGHQLDMADASVAVSDVEYRSLPEDTPTSSTPALIQTSTAFGEPQKTYEQYGIVWIELAGETDRYFPSDFVAEPGEIQALTATQRFPPELKADLGIEAPHLTRRDGSSPRWIAVGLESDATIDRVGLDTNPTYEDQVDVWWQFG